MIFAGLSIPPDATSWESTYKLLLSQEIDAVMTNAVADHNQKSQCNLALPTLGFGQGQLTLVQNRASKIWETLSAKDTGDVYWQAVVKTWRLLKQTIALLFFLWILLVALIIWVWGIGFKGGLHFRTWLEVKQPPLDKVAATCLKGFFVWPFERIFEWASNFVKKHLGWEVEFTPITSESTPTKSESTSVKSAEAKQSSLES